MESKEFHLTGTVIIIINVSKLCPEILSTNPYRNLYFYNDPS